MDQDDIPFASAEGLRFCKTAVLDDSRIRSVLKSFFKWSGLGLYRSIGARPGAYAFMQSDPDAEVEGLLVRLATKGSKATFWRGSHRCQWPSTIGENNLWFVPRAALAKLRLFGVEPVTCIFEHGGLIIIDPRVPTEIIEGETTTFGFGTKEVLEGSWKPMKIPKTDDIEEVISIMESSDFGINKEYIEPQRKR
ncbi:hypothetical protein J3459_016947 [Metarhizium acridum]|nr:hypothetical protein J3459_016947 [Metarhizium acridum]